MARILLLSSYEPPPDGIAKHSSQLVDAWDSAGHSVLVVSPGKQLSLNEAQHIGSNSRVARVLRLLPRRRTWKDIVGFKPDVVIVQFAIAALSVNIWSVRSLCKRFSAARTPVVVTFHEPAREYNLLGFVTRLIYRMMVRVTDVPIVFSPAGRQALVERGLFENVVEVPLGTIGVTEITDEEIAHVRDLYEIRKPLVLTLGFTTVDKGVDVLLDAASEIAEMRSNDVQFLIAGKPRRRRGIFRVMERPDVKCQQRLETQANQLENVDIAFTDFVANADVAALLHTADVVVLPYRRITQSGVANLTLSSRSVVVCSDLPGLRSDLGNSAKYVAVGDPKALAEQVVSLLDEDGRLTRSHMRELSGKCASENTFAKVAESILAAGLAHRESETTTS